MDAGASAVRQHPGLVTETLSQENETKTRSPKGYQIRICLQ